MTTKHQVVDSRGQTHKRVSKHRVYGFATVTHYPAWKHPHSGEMMPSHSSAEWSATRQNAEIARRRSERCGRDAEIIEAVIL